jgi:hypothetical protein
MQSRPDDAGAVGKLPAPILHNHETILHNPEDAVFITIIHSN